jgi:phage FluMu protein Com
MSTAVPQAAQSSTSRRASLWVRELPFSLVLILTVLGVAYTSFTKRPIIGYWEILAPIVGLVCVGVGWQSVNDKAGRLRLIATQAHGHRYFHLADAGHLYRRRSCPFLANLSSRPDHGARHPGDCLDRKFGVDFRFGCGRRAWNCRGILVVLAKGVSGRYFRQTHCVIFSIRYCATASSAANANPTHTEGTDQTNEGAVSECQCCSRRPSALIAARHWFLRVHCPACRTINAIDLRTLDRHSRTSIADEMREEHRRRMMAAQSRTRIGRHIGSAWLIIYLFCDFVGKGGGL